VCEYSNRSPGHESNERPSGRRTPHPSRATPRRRLTCPHRHARTPGTHSMQSSGARTSGRPLLPRQPVSRGTHLSRGAGRAEPRSNTAAIRAGSPPPRGHLLLRAGCLEKSSQMMFGARSCIGCRRGARGRRPPSELARDVRSATQAARHVPLDLGSQAAAAATACFGLLEAIKFVSDSTSRHWDVLFDRTTVDMSTDGRNLARGIPWGAGEALGPVRRAIPGDFCASGESLFFCVT
jgi:hypothetical protein